MSNWRIVRSHDDSGVPNTCGLIDEVLSIVSAKEYDHDTDISGIPYLMEQIRTHNEQLRMWGSQKNLELEEALEELKCQTIEP